MTAEASTGDHPGFAALLRQRRRAAGLTQVELARRAGLAVRTVRDVERGRTQRPQRTTAVLLADALDLTGEERAGFLGAARGGGAWPVLPRTRAAAAGRGIPLPPAPLLMGRETDLVRLSELLTNPDGDGPLTLVGVAGVGKSALALALAHEVAARFPGGVAGVAATHHRRAADLVAAVEAAFAAPDPGTWPGSGPASGSMGADGLAGRLAIGPALLVLDAVDQDPDQVRAALGRLPSALRVLATSRAPLGLPTEQIWPVTPLPVPPASPDLPVAEIARYPAAALFLDRLGRVRPVPPAPDEVPALVGLVRRVGGLPLALELAAGYGRRLRLPEILQRYGDRVLDLGGGDEQTLRAAVASSYRLLSPPEQAALRWLAAFREWWSAELAEQLLAAANGRANVADPVPALDRMLSLGLVEAREQHEHRFRVLEVVRDFAAEQAQRHDELAAARSAHAAVVAQLVTRTSPALAGPELPAAAARLDELASEVWAALNHAANHDPPAALRLAAALPRWWRLRGWDVGGRRWLRRLLDDPRTAGADPAVRAWAQVGVARLALEHGEGQAERSAAEAGLAEFRRLSEVAGELAACHVLSAVCRAEGSYDQAREYAATALAMATRHGRARDTAVAHLNLTGHELRVADLAAARRRLAAVDRVATQLADARLRLLATARLAEVARLEGRYEEAAATGQRVLARLGELPEPGHRRRLLGTVGQALAALGRRVDAAQVLARLRGEPGPVAGTCAAIEAQLALARGDRAAAAERFAEASSALRDGEQRRQLVEVLVELAACLTDRDRRAGVLAELSQVCHEDGFVLCERERAVLDRIAG